MIPKTVFLIALLMGLTLCGNEPATCAEPNYDIKQMTPEINQAIRNRQERYAEIRILKTEGKIGEDKRGYIKVLEGSAGLQEMAQAENKDRRVIYQAIVDQNKIGRDGIEKVELAFGDVHRERAPAGEWIELPSGEWVQKKS